MGVVVISSGIEPISLGADKLISGYGIYIAIHHISFIGG